MRRATLALLTLTLTLALAASAASAGVPVGVAEDATKFADDGGATLFPTMVGAGLTVNRVSVFWDERHPLRIAEAPMLAKLLPAAASAGVRVVFQVRPQRARAFARQTQLRIRLFARFLQRVARAYPQVHEYIVGNEPNQPRFSQPQFDTRGRPVAAGIYERLLAASYDALKAASARNVVIGLGLSARGNDDPHARDNVSRSPVRFTADLGRAYRASGRKRPLMDQLAFHPYPNVNTNPPGKGYVWPNAGIPDLDRIKQAIWDAFHGTAQPTFAEPGSGGRRRLGLVIDEAAWQVGIPPELQHLYFGRESVPVVDEQTQARYYTSALAALGCDPAVRMVLFFRLIDAADLDRFQSGFLRIDGSPRPALDAVKTAVATPPPCTARSPWRHTTSVTGARVRVDRGPLAVTVRVSAREGAIVTARLVTAGGRVVASARAHPKAERSVRLRLPLPQVSGRYRVRVLVQAEVNPARTVRAAKSLKITAR